MKILFAISKLAWLALRFGALLAVVKVQRRLGVSTTASVNRAYAKFLSFAAEARSIGKLVPLLILWRRF